MSQAADPAPPSFWRTLRMRSRDAVEAALARADDLLTATLRTSSDGPVADAPITSIGLAVAQDPARNFALISVPGDYAAAEAMKALHLGMDVMMFSDNVTVADEVRLKTYARDHNLMVMGPDCGTAIVNGTPLGFANVVRRGPIGVVGASGTGTQEVTVRIHQIGSGVSQALGTGGHDLSDAVAGISMLHGLHALANDPSTEVIVLVSKPPSPAIAAQVLDATEAVTKPVVVIFLGADPASVERRGVHGAASLAHAADVAVALATGTPVPSGDVLLSGETRRRLDDLARAMAPSQRDVRGVFSGGTFCFEAQLIHAAAGITCYSNGPTSGNAMLPDLRTSVGNTIIDMGDDEFTQGRPHPMIDPSGRDTRIRDEVADPSTAVVLFDVVLGYGSSLDPVRNLVSVLGAARAAAKAAGRTVALIGYVCGTDSDPQSRHGVISTLAAAGVMVASSNAEAAAWSAYVVDRRKESPS